MVRIAAMAFVTLTGLISCAITSDVERIKISETDETVAQRQLLIGTWGGEASVSGGGIRHWVITRNPDGTYKTDFTHKGVAAVPEMQSEAGIWGVSGGIYFTATRGFVHQGVVKWADTNDPSLYDTYRIVSLDDTVFEYESLSTGNRFLVRKIGVPSDAL